MPTIPEYRVRARNCSTDSENVIHADAPARQFGLRGGLVPGVVVFGYAVQPVIDSYGLAWLERGSVQIKLLQPVYDGDDVLVRARRDSEADPVELAVSVERGPGELCASGQAAAQHTQAAFDWEAYPERPLPIRSERPVAAPDVLAPGTVLGTVKHTLDSSQSRVFEALHERHELFVGPQALTHPAVLLELANQALMQNVKLGPWLHASSIVTNWSVVRNGEEVQVRSRIAACYERKGHEFVVLDVVILGPPQRVIQQVTHTAIFRPRFVRDHTM